MFPPSIIGGLVPIVLPLILLAVGSLAGNVRTRQTAFAVGQSRSSAGWSPPHTKAITGRVHPAQDVGPDLSHLFRFGFLRGGVFWGWPSSHTTIAFAMAVTVFTLFPKRRWLGYVAIIYALYVASACP